MKIKTKTKTLNTVQRLEALKDHISAQPHDSFNIDTTWCKSAGCYLGHSANVKAFQDDPKLDIKKHLYSDNHLSIEVNGRFGENALAEILHVSEEDAFRLFIGFINYDNNPSKKYIYGNDKVNALKLLDHYIDKYKDRYRRINSLNEK